MSQLILFDYSSLSPDLQVEVKSATERIKLRMKRTAEDIIEIGKDLIAIKEKLPHGQFLPWIATEFEMEERTARRFMSVAERFPEIGHFDRFKPATLYELAAPSTPDQVVEQVIEKAQNGETVTVKDVKELKAKLKETESKLRQKDSEIANLTQANRFAAQQLEEKKALLTAAEKMLHTEANRIAEQRIEQVEAQYKVKIASYERDIEQLEEKLESNQKSLEKFKANPDPETKKAIAELQQERAKLLSDLGAVKLRMEEAVSIEEHRANVMLNVKSFFSGIKEVCDRHSDFLINKEVLFDYVQHLDDAHIAQLSDIGTFLEDVGQLMRECCEDARAGQAKLIPACEVLDVA
jgi:myosin heavy subunit